MNTFLRRITDAVSTKKGMWLTLAIWLLATVLLVFFAPSAKEYESSNTASLPNEAKSVIAQNKLDKYFEGNDGTPAILVFQAKDKKEIAIAELETFIQNVANVDGVKEVVPLMSLPPQATSSFLSKDKSTIILPVTFESDFEAKDMRSSQEEMLEMAEKSTDLSLTITGPAGIAVDALNLFSRADLVLLLSTVALILVLLIIIYRSPLLAFIPLVAAAFVYGVVNQVLGLMGKAGLSINNQTFSIMTILLFAAVIDYSLFVFSRYREELKKHESKHIAMKEAMRETGLPVFFSGGTVLAAMLVLFFAEFGDYRNFAPIFATAMFIIMLASVTLVPALFTLFGRKSFWPKIPIVGDETVKVNSIWSKIGRGVVKRPLVSTVIIGLILLISALNMFNLKYEFDTMKSFPEDMPSRIGYEILGEKFGKGELAPTTVLLEADKPISQAQQLAIINVLQNQNLVNSVRPYGSTEDQRVVQYSLTFKESPYDSKTMDALEGIRENSKQIIEEVGMDAELYFSGATANRIDDRATNNRDLIVIVLLESILIFAMLIVMTRSFKLPLYMMGTILLSFLAAVGLGMFLSNLFFNIDNVSNRVPLYSFVFLVALGIDYNIILISRFMEERKRHPVRKAVEMAVANTGGVISSAGLILAATFAVLMTQPIQLLFVFGFIVAVGILLDTFLIRGILLPALLVLFEKEGSAQKSD